MQEIQTLCENVKSQTKKACEELIEISKIGSGQILIIGCSTSEVVGEHIGKASNVNVAEAIYEGIMEATRDKGIYVAAQCCEHLNRAVVIEKEALLPGADIVNVVPQIHAGGSFATTVYKNAKCPVVVEEIRADAGIDIGSTLIGMHLKKVAVPVRLQIKSIGSANLVCARTRPKFVGGGRAIYDEKLSGGEIPR